jgi:predicted outer membrane protein
VLAILVLFLMLPFQQHEYSTPPGGHRSRSGGSAARNAVDYTSDGEFLKQTAEHNAFLIALFTWTKEHSEDARIRTVAGDLLAAHLRFGEDLRKLAARKHVSLPVVPDSEAGQAFMANAGQTPAQTFADDVWNHCLVEIARFDTEAKKGSDPDIRRWASTQISVFEKDQLMVQPLRRPRRAP